MVFAQLIALQALPRHVGQVVVKGVLAVVAIFRRVAALLAHIWSLKAMLIAGIALHSVRLGPILHKTRHRSVAASSFIHVLIMSFSKHPVLKLCLM